MTVAMRDRVELNMVMGSYRVTQTNRYTLLLLYIITDISGKTEKKTQTDGHKRKQEQKIPYKSLPQTNTCVSTFNLYII